MLLGRLVEPPWHAIIDSIIHCPLRNNQVHMTHFMKKERIYAEPNTKKLRGLFKYSLHPKKYPFSNQRRFSYGENPVLQIMNTLKWGLLTNIWCSSIWTGLQTWFYHHPPTPPPLAINNDRSFIHLIRRWGKFVVITWSLSRCTLTSASSSSTSPAAVESGNSCNSIRCLLSPDAMFIQIS